MDLDKKLRRVVRVKRPRLSPQTKYGDDSGWVPDPQSDKYWDFKDLCASWSPAVEGNIDLRPYTSPRHDQRWTKSCVAQAVVKALEIKRIIEFGHEAHVDLSIMQLWYLARELMVPPSHRHNSGTFISTACDCLRRFGAAPESDWPWDTSKVGVAPSWRAMRRAYLHRIAAYYRIKSTGEERVRDVITALRMLNPVVFGTVTGANWHSYRAGQVLDLPGDATGRHATVLVGYIDGLFVGENSWGADWGESDGRSRGFYLMRPGVIASSESSDFWVMTGSWEEFDDE